MMKGYDAQNVLLLPPRAPGEPLPAELLDYCKEHKSQETEIGAFSLTHPLMDSWTQNANDESDHPPITIVLFLEC